MTERSGAPCAVEDALAGDRRLCDCDSATSCGGVLSFFFLPRDDATLGWVTDFALLSRRGEVRMGVACSTAKTTSSLTAARAASLDGWWRRRQIAPYAYVLLVFAVAFGAAGDGWCGRKDG